MKKTFSRLLICSLAMSAAFSAQAQTEGSSGSGLGSMFMNSVKKALNKNGVPTTDTAQNPNASNNTNYQKLVDTKLKDLFKSYPVKNDMNPPAFPKVAIRITSFSKSLDQWENRTNTPNECVTYNVTLWMDENKSEKIDNLRMCSPDLAFNISFVSVRSPWPVKFNYNKNSGQVRDDGPVAPKAPYPSDPVARGFMYGGGVYFIGSMFIQMGYDWDYPHDTMRVWVSGVSPDGKFANTPSTPLGGQAGGQATNNVEAAPEPGEYVNTPAPGNYDGSDRNFERSLVVKANGRFALKVTGKGGNAKTGSGEGQLTDAPGGWSFNTGSCTMTLKRAAGGVKLHAEGCAETWGDVNYDNRYQFKGKN